jgi:hypothetical protein
MDSPHYKVSWYIQDRVLLIKVVGEITVNQTRQMEKEAFDFIKRAPNLVHAIVDLSALGARPPGVGQAFGNINAPRHKNQGTSVIINPMGNPVVRFICSSVLNNMNLSFKFCTSYEEAEQKIAKLEMERKKSRTS